MYLKEPPDSWYSPSEDEEEYERERFCERYADEKTNEFIRVHDDDPPEEFWNKWWEEAEKLFDDMKKEQVNDYEY